MVTNDHRLFSKMQKYGIPKFWSQWHFKMISTPCVILDREFWFILGLNSRINPHASVESRAYVHLHYLNQCMVLSLSLSHEMLPLFLQAFFTLARDIKLKMDKKLVSLFTKITFLVRMILKQFAKTYGIFPSFFICRNNRVHRRRQQFMLHNNLNNPKGFSAVQYCRMLQNS